MALERGIYSDIDSFLSRNPTTGDAARVLDEQAIRQAIINLVFTGQYDRLFQPDLFCGIEHDLFELSSPIAAENIRKKILAVIANYEPRAVEVSCTVRPTAQSNGYNVTLIYTPRKNIEPITVAFFLQRAA